MNSFVHEMPNNPVVLWFEGQKKMNDRNRQQVIDGLTDMIVAIEKYHVDRYIALTDDLLERLHKARKIIQEK